jgi:hypothetical protein
MGKMFIKKQQRSLCLVTPVVSCFALHIVTRVEWSVSKHLSAQGRPDPRGGLRCFWCLDKTLTPLIGTSGALKIIKNELELKTYGPQSKGVKNSKTKPLKATKPVPKHPKHS